MKGKMKKVIFALVMFMGLTASAYSNSNPDEEQLIKMRLNEKIAYDLYSEFYDMWKLEVFFNISESKVVHKMRMKELLKRYSITDPVENNYDRGKFDDKKTQEVYDEYLKNGSISKMHALRTCALIEEQIYKDLDLCLIEVSDNTSRKVIKQMIMTTGTHLKAVVKNLNSNGELYTPKLLTDSEFDKIMGSDNVAAVSSND